ncbi:hypothetical protein [Caulobacter sp. S45]|uniref:hypothetical protein n=1 Tax=Caulobacter sp. S45 TaxID=1641861 RepID=UPI00131D2500|nr:hypothetical protein [Caulobacter sp. S45]
MNAPIRTLSVRPATSFAGLLLLMSTLVGVGGCADVRQAVWLPPVNPESPVAAAVTVASARTYARPRLRDVPPPPKNIPSAPMVKQGVVKLVGCRRAIYGYAAAHPPLTRGGEAYAGDQREIARVNPADVPPPDSAARSEALAERLRAFAAPPAALGSGPAPTASMALPPQQPAASAAPAPHAAAPVHPRTPPAAPAQAAAQTTVVTSTPVVAMQDETTASEPLIDKDIPPMPRPLADPLVERCS